MFKIKLRIVLVRELILAILGWSLYFPIALKTGSVILSYSLSIGSYFGISMVSVMVLKYLMNTSSKRWVRSYPVLN